MAAKTIVALYDEFADAVRAVRELEKAGFQHEDISLIAQNAENRPPRERVREADHGETQAAEGAGTGATMGAIAGGAVGLLAGLGAIAIPGIGPVIAAGPLVATLAGAGVGAAAGGIIGGLVGLGVPEEEAHAYAEGVRRGGALVTASVPEREVSRAIDILERHDAVDVEERQAEWRKRGWGRFDERAEPMDVESMARERDERRGATVTTGAGFQSNVASGRAAADVEAPDAPATPSKAGMAAVSGDTSATTQAGTTEEALRSGLIEREADTAAIRGGPVSTAMSAMPGSTEGLREQDEPLKYHGDPARRRARSYERGAASPGDRGNQAMDRAAAGDKPVHRGEADRRPEDDPLAGRK